MKHAYALIAVTGLTFGSAGCFLNSSDSGNPPPTPAAGEDPGIGHETLGSLPWKLRFTSNCPSEKSEKCVGHFGYTVLANGQFQVGPGPQGQVVKGALPADEFKPLAEAVQKIESSIHPEGAATAIEPVETCAPRSQQGTDDSVTLNLRGSEREMIRLSSSNICFKSVNQQEAEALHKAIQDLARRYYPIPFPDDCLDAILAVEELYEPLRGCQLPQDCAYLDSSYQPIAPGEMQFVVTDSCTKLKPLVVAHAAAARSQRDALLAARERARRVCGDRIARPDCRGIAGFQAAAAPPVCAAGVCQVNPTLQ